MSRIYLRSIVVFVLLSSCCYKKDCAMVTTPTIAVQFSGFTDNDLKQRVIYIADNGSYKVLDSITFYYDIRPVATLGYTVSNLDLKQEAFIITTPATRDTIKNINYNTVTHNISCNQCFPVGHDEQAVTTFTNFSYTFRNNISIADTISIVK